MLKSIVAGLAMAMLCVSTANAATVCAWIVETNQPNDVHQLELWLQSDAEMDFLYKIGGKGLVSESMTMHSPASGTFHLLPRRADSPWKYGATLEPPGKIDVTVELHKSPVDIFSDAPTPLLAKFVFQRAVPDGEMKAPPVFARKQCVSVALK